MLENTWAYWVYSRIFFGGVGWGGGLWLICECGLYTGVYGILIESISICFLTACQRNSRTFEGWLGFKDSTVTIRWIVHKPFSCGICAIQRKFHLNYLTILFPQLSWILRVKLDQLWQSGKLLPSIQVIKVSCVLDLNVRDLSISSVGEFDKICLIKLVYTLFGQPRPRRSSFWT